jgi:hypothetical protein
MMNQLERTSFLMKTKGMVSSTPFQVFDLCDASFDDLESEEFLEETLGFGELFI